MKSSSVTERKNSPEEDANKVAAELAALADQLNEASARLKALVDNLRAEGEKNDD